MYPDDPRYEATRLALAAYLADTCPRSEAMLADLTLAEAVDPPRAEAMGQMWDGLEVQASLSTAEMLMERPDFPHVPTTDGVDFVEIIRRYGGPDLS